MNRASAKLRLFACGLVVVLGGTVLWLGPRSEADLRSAASRRVEALTGEFGQVVSGLAAHAPGELPAQIRAWVVNRPEHLEAEVELDGCPPIVASRDGDQRRPDPPLASAGMAIYRGGERWGTARLSMFEHEVQEKPSAGQWMSDAYGIAGAGMVLLLGLVAIRTCAAALGAKGWGVWSRARERVSETLDFLAEGVVLFDGSGRVVFANQAFAEAVGRAPIDLRGQHGGQLGLRVVPSTGDDVPPWELASARSPVPANIRVQHDGGPGRRRVFNVSCTVIGSRKGKLGVLATFDDVTVLEQQREELRLAKDAATHASEAKSGFLANMSHEIRTPINGVMGTLELLQLTSLTGSQQRYLDAARGSAGTLLHLINDILDFSKIEAGKLELNSVIFSLEESVRQAAQVVAPAAAAKNIELIVSAASVSGLQAWGDPDRFKQILLNLASNAIKFTHSGQVVIFVQAEVEAGDKLRVDVDVQDSGIGMTPDQLRRLFRSFSQADASTSRKYGGTGLGLAISKQLCELMHGFIQVVSTEGVGSTFSFTVRLSAGGTTPSLAPVEMAARASHAIIAFEPSALAARALVASLRASGFTATRLQTADDLHAAVRQQMAAASQATIIISAIAWTDEHTKIAESLRTYVDAGRCRVLGATMIEPGATLEASLAHVVDGWVQKPFTAQSLARALSAERADSARSAQPWVEFNPDAAAACRVLVAEDNPVGQLVTGDYLRTLGLGYRIVDRGDLVVEAAAQEHYDLILMDCHLPVLDGFAATALIRERERQKERRPVKILALTAAAMEEDRQRCIRAGMDGYLSKPLELSTLARALAEYLRLPLKASGGALSVAESAAPKRSIPEPPSPAEPSNGEPDGRLINTGSLLNRCMNKAELAIAMLQVFEKTIEDDLSQLQAAIDQGSRESAAEVAHAIVGSAAQVGAESVAVLARRIEIESSIHQAEWLKEQADQLAAECRKCVGHTERLRSEGPDALRSRVAHPCSSPERAGQ